MQALVHPTEDKELELTQVRSFLYSAGFRKLHPNFAMSLHRAKERWVNQVGIPVSVAVTEDTGTADVRTHTCKTYGEILKKIFEIQTHKLEKRWKTNLQS
jgi:hypothetical protein